MAEPGRCPSRRGLHVKVDGGGGASVQIHMQMAGRTAAGTAWGQEVTYVTGGAGPRPYNRRMSRLLDKTIVLLSCLALLARGPVDAALVSWLCVAVTVACLGEAVPPRVRPVLPLVLLTCGALAPGAGAYLPLAAYDLARPWLPGGRDVHGARRWPHALPAAAGALLTCACVAVAPATAPVTLLCAGLACLLSVRSTQMERAAAANRQTRDALQGRALELAAKNRDLMDRQEYEVELATLAERARIAREIHDNVGHLLTRATLQVEALRVVHADDPRVQEDFAAVGTTLGEALDTVRTSVHALREDAVDLGVQVRKAVADVTDASPIAVELDVRCDRVPANVSSCLLAVTREALSNALRHADAEHVAVRCVEHPGLFQLEVIDDGRGGDGRGGAGAAGEKSAGAAGPASGMGLASMRERVEALGGTFSAGPVAGGGWRVFATVPKGAAGRGGA